MDKHMTRSLLMRGLVFGLLAALIDGFSLPILHELFSMLLSVLDTGKWHGPLGIAKLWGVWFVFGFAFSLVPNTAMGVILSIGMRYLLSRKTYVKWLSIGAVTFVGLLVAVCYVLLLFHFEILISRDRSILAAIVCAEQMLIYGWMAARSAAHQRAQR